MDALQIQPKIWYPLECSSWIFPQNQWLTLTDLSIQYTKTLTNKIKNYGYNSKDLHHMLLMHLQIIDKKVKSRLLTSKSRRYQLWAISKLGITTSTRKHTGATNVLKEDTSHVSKSSTWPGNKEQSSNMNTIWPKPCKKQDCLNTFKFKASVQDNRRRMQDSNWSKTAHMNGTTLCMIFHLVLFNVSTATFLKLKDPPPTF